MDVLYLEINGETFCKNPDAIVQRRCRGCGELYFTNVKSHTTGLVCNPCKRVKQKAAEKKYKESLYRKQEIERELKNKEKLL